MKRRIKRIEFTNDLFCRMFRRGNRLNVKVDETQGLPDDAKVVGLAMNSGNDQSLNRMHAGNLMILVESKEFPEVEFNPALPADAYEPMEIVAHGYGQEQLIPKYKKSFWQKLINLFS